MYVSINTSYIKHFSHCLGKPMQYAIKRPKESLCIYYIAYDTFKN